MNFSTLKKLSLTCAVGAAMFASGQAMAQATATANVPATFTTAAGVTAAVVNTLDFGEWLVVIDGTETPTILIPPTGATPTPVTGGITNSVVSQVTAPAQSGSATVNSPVTGTVQISGTVVDFVDTEITLSLPTYSVAASAPVAIPTTPGTPTVATVAATDVTVEIGGTLTINTQPTFSNAYTGATVNLTFTL